MKRTIKDFDLWNKKVIIRCDFNVPIKEGKIIDDNRIVQALETINYAINKYAKVILMSHLGRIKSEDDKKNQSLKIIADALSKLLKQQVIFVGETRGEQLESVIVNLKNKEVVLIENTRFEDYPNKLESNNDLELAKYWAGMGDIFINDAFGVAHRSHASNVGIANQLPNGIGFLVEKEITILNNLLEMPETPFTIILGGIKVSDKIQLVKNLVEKADQILIGGGMAFTFLHVKGINVGKSIIDYDSISFCEEILLRYSHKIILPIDIVCEDETKLIADLNDNDIGYDIGPESIALFINCLKTSKTVFWNGPVGLFEEEKYSNGTKGIANYLKDKPIKVIIGGGDTSSAIIEFGYWDCFSHISTGGGASLEFLSSNELPGLKVIGNK